jgi:hypothetical protein
MTAAVLRLRCRWCALAGGFNNRSPDADLMRNVSDLTLALWIA